MRRVLLVSPHFCPVNAADMQRARLALPHLREHGWEPTVLALQPEAIEAPVIDPLLEQTYPADVPVVRAVGLPPRLTRAFGFGGLWLRTGRAFRRAGDALLRTQRFDLVFFTTTQFDFLRLAQPWRERFDVPFVLDYQDPWVNDYYQRTGTPPPGGRLRYWLAHRRGRKQEPRTLRAAAGVVSVSPAYLDALAGRYPWFDRSKSLVLPFGAAAADFAVARSHRPALPRIARGDGLVHLVSAGRAGPDLAPALTRLFGALAALRRSHPAAADRLRLHFIGTSYAPPALARETVTPVAERFGVRDLVHEHAARVPYFEALHYLAHADGILALGSDDPAYTPSKLVPVLLAGRPVVAILRAESPAVDLARVAGATVACFGADRSETGGPDPDLQRWLERAPDNPAPDSTSPALREHTAENMTRRLAGLFDLAVSSHP